LRRRAGVRRRDERREYATQPTKAAQGSTTTITQVRTRSIFGWGSDRIEGLRERKAQQPAAKKTHGSRGREREPQRSRFPPRRDLLVLVDDVSFPEPEVKGSVPPSSLTSYFNGVFEDTDIPSLLKTLDPKAGDKLSRVLIHDLIDFLLLHKEERRKALRLLGEIKATEQH
jgi:hypothetical protein